MPSEVDFGAYRVADPEEFSRNMLRLMEEGGKVMAGFLERADGKAGPFSTASEMTDAAKLFGEVAQAWLKDPAKVAATQSALVRDLMLLAGMPTRHRRRYPVKLAEESNPPPGSVRTNRAVLRTSSRQGQADSTLAQGRGSRSRRSNEQRSRFSHAHPTDSDE